MKKHDFDPNETLKRTRQLENEDPLSPFDSSKREDIKVQIRVNESVSPGMFRPDPLIPGGYVANSLTIKAMRQDIFVLGESMDELKTPYECGCGVNLDLQFWKLCPHCGRDIKV